MAARVITVTQKHHHITQSSAERVPLATTAVPRGLQGLVGGLQGPARPSATLPDGPSFINHHRPGRG